MRFNKYNFNRVSKHNFAMSKSNYKLSDFVIRPARLDDYEGVMAISGGIYGGRDILPSVYEDYLKDPNRGFYVATLNGKVVS